ncbi:hypothetical protein [Panacagrimonas sp.]|uniref:hypothetical protein n=1 Tax=Panacagrimonas sp. TaxID=2480088 RepID=UPI003B519244
MARCQVCGLSISARCVRCPRCLSRSPTVRRVSVAGALVVLLISLYFLLLYKFA